MLAILKSLSSPFFPIIFLIYLQILEAMNSNNFSGSGVIKSSFPELNIITVHFGFVFLIISPGNFLGL